MTYPDIAWRRKSDLPANLPLRPYDDSRIAETGIETSRNRILYWYTSFQTCVKYVYSKTRLRSDLERIIADSIGRINDNTFQILANNTWPWSRYWYFFDTPHIEIFFEKLSNQYEFIFTRMYNYNPKTLWVLAWLNRASEVQHFFFWN